MGRLFLPFTDLGRRIEKRAVALKNELDVGPYGAVDPYEVLPRVPARLVSRDFFGSLPPRTQKVLFNRCADEWSAVALGAPPGDEVERIMLNPTHHPRRRRVSLMEEIVHLLRDHPRVVLEPGGEEKTWGRTYDEAVEREAFAVGAACILPYRGLFRALNDRGETVAALARRHDVSKAYVEYRIKLSGLYNVLRASRK